MKSLVLGLTLFAAPVFAATPSEDMVRVSRALINSPAVTAQLEAQATATLKSYEIVESNHGVVEYRLKFDRNCFCIPATASVKITEDLRPTFVDGPAKYTGTVEITENRE